MKKICHENMSLVLFQDSYYEYLNCSYALYFFVKSLQY